MRYLVVPFDTAALGGDFSPEEIADGADPYGTEILEPRLFETPLEVCNFLDEHVGTDWALFELVKGRFLRRAITFPTIS